MVKFDWSMLTAVLAGGSVGLFLVGHPIVGGIVAGAAYCALLVTITYEDGW